MIATDGHHSLGGADVDQRLLDLVLARLEELMPAAELDEIVEDKRRLSELVLDVEAAKRDLSARVSRPVIVRTGPGKVSVTVTRADLDAVCGDLFDTTAEIIERVLTAARAEGAGPVDDVIMVGGSSRIPVLAERLLPMLGVLTQARRTGPGRGQGGRAAGSSPWPGRRSWPALAAGGRLAADREGHARSTPRAVGILVEDSHDPQGERSFVEHFVTANTPLPGDQDRRTRFGTILANQESVRIQVYEQAGSAPSAEVEHNRLVLDGELTQIPPLPAGSVIKITVRIAIDGRLHGDRARAGLRP